MVIKTKLHPRNQHSEGYDFVRLVAQTPELEAFVINSPVGKTTIDFQDVGAVRMLNRALLKTHYDIDFWDIPAGYLCPPIPGRVDYIHYLADLLAGSNDQEIPQGRHIKVLDIGTGASLVFPLRDKANMAGTLLASISTRVRWNRRDKFVTATNWRSPLGGKANLITSFAVCSSPRKLFTSLCAIHLSTGLSSKRTRAPNASGQTSAKVIQQNLTLVVKTLSFGVRVAR